MSLRVSDYPREKIKAQTASLNDANKILPPPGYRPTVVRMGATSSKIRPPCVDARAVKFSGNVSWDPGEVARRINTRKRDA